MVDFGSGVVLVLLVASCTGSGYRYSKLRLRMTSPDTESTVDSICRTFGIIENPQLPLLPVIRTWPTDNNHVVDKCRDSVRKLLETGVKPDLIKAVTSQQTANGKLDVVASLKESLKTLEKFSGVCSADMDLERSTIERLLELSKATGDSEEFLRNAFKFAPQEWWEQVLNDEEINRNFNISLVAEELVQRRRYKSTLPVYLNWIKAAQRPCNEDTLMAILRYDAERTKPFETEDQFHEMFDILCVPENDAGSWDSIAVADVLQDESIREASPETRDLILRNGAGPVAQILSKGSQYSAALLCKTLVKCKDKKCVDDSLQLLQEVEPTNRMGISPRTLTCVMNPETGYPVDKKKLLEKLVFLNDVGFVSSGAKGYDEHLDNFLVFLYSLEAKADSAADESKAAGGPSVHPGTQLLIKKYSENNWDIKNTSRFLIAAHNMQLYLDDFEKFFEVVKTNDISKIADIAEMFSKSGVKFAVTQPSKWSYGHTNIMWKKMKENKLELDLERFAELSKSRDYVKLAFTIYFNNNDIERCDPEILRSISKFDYAHKNVMHAINYKRLLNEACTEQDKYEKSFRIVIDTATAEKKTPVQLLNDLKEHRKSLGLPQSCNPAGTKKTEKDSILKRESTVAAKAEAARAAAEKAEEEKAAKAEAAKAGAEKAPAEKADAAKPDATKPGPANGAATGPANGAATGAATSAANAPPFDTTLTPPDTAGAKSPANGAAKPDAAEKAAAEKSAAEKAAAEKAAAEKAAAEMAAAANAVAAKPGPANGAATGPANGAATGAATSAANAPPVDTTLTPPETAGAAPASK